MKHRAKYLTVCTLAAIASLTLTGVAKVAPAAQAHEIRNGKATSLRSPTSALRLLGTRIEHPEDGITISHLFFRRMVKGAADRKLEIIHHGYLNCRADGQPEILKNQDQTVNIMGFNTGAHMRSTVVVLCEGGSTRIISNFDEQVLSLCSARGLSVCRGYVDVFEVKGRTLGVSLMSYGLQGRTAYVRLLPGGSIRLLSFNRTH